MKTANIKRTPTAPRFANIKVSPAGFDGQIDGYAFSASFNLFLIREAWERGCTDVERHADGFGPGNGTMGGDWSGIRDSTVDAKNRMLESALNFLFPGETRGRHS